MTTYQPLPPEPQPGDHSTRETALWAGACAFFGNLLGLKVIDKLTGDTVVQILGAVFISLIAGGAVYSKERLAAARRAHDE